MPAMTTEEAIKLLRGGTDGVAEWNRRREAGESIPDLSGADLSYAILTYAKLSGANLSGADLSGARLEGVTLIGADLRNVTVDALTLFTRAKVKDCTIDRSTLESLDKYGGLTKGDRMVMNIVDGTAELRKNFSGFMHWVHMLAMTAFVFPYAWFVIKHWSVARFTQATGTEPLWRALLQFIWTGGDWPSGGFNPCLFVFFCGSLFYNAFRFALLAKTKRLELYEQITGLPPIFSLAGGWRYLFLFVKFGVYANVGLMAYHTWHFMSQRIPLPEG